MANIKVLFVCLGNICRSPTAEGVFSTLLNEKQLSDWIEVDSAGTHAYHVGAAPDRRAQEAAKLRNISIGHLQGRKVNIDDFEYFDYILAMDNENHYNLMDICADQHKHKVRLFLSFSTNADAPEEVPDPYYGGNMGFERVLDLVEDASKGLLQTILKQHA